MTPGKFEYAKPASVAEAASMLKEDADEVYVLAGGQSIISLMKLRQSAPRRLIDLNGIDELRAIEVGADEIAIGAMATQNQVIGDAKLAEACPLLAEAAAQIADPQVRSRGTIGGNAANGDQANDMPAVMQALDAEYVLVSADGERSVKARDFYEGGLETERAENEILVRIKIPRPAAGHGWAYVKQKRKTGDYATAAVAVLLRKDGDACADVAIGLTNVADVPVCASEAAALLKGPGDAGAAAAKAAELADPPEMDPRGPAEFRRHLVEVLAKEAIAAAIARAK